MLDLPYSLYSSRNCKITLLRLEKIKSSTNNIILYKSPFVNTQPVRCLTIFCKICVLKIRFLHFLVIVTHKTTRFWIYHTQIMQKQHKNPKLMPKAEHIAVVAKKFKSTICTNTKSQQIYILCKKSTADQLTKIERDFFYSILI